MAWMSVLFDAVFLFIFVFCLLYFVFVSLGWLNSDSLPNYLVYRLCCLLCFAINWVFAHVVLTYG